MCYMILYDEVTRKCELPDFLKEDLDAYSILPKPLLALKTWSAQIHLYDALYGTIESGRYNLALSCKSIFEDTFKIDDEDDEFLHRQFLNSALMHYNSSYDISLECIWIGFGLYRYFKNEGPFSLNTNKEIEKILRLCNYNRIKSVENKIDVSLYEKLKILRKKQQEIAGWTNNLKHRGNLVYSEFYEELIVAKTISKEGKDVFDSSKTQSQVTFDKVVNSLIEYHNALIQFVKHMDFFYRDKIMKTAINNSM